MIPASALKRCIQLSLLKDPTKNLKKYKLKNLKPPLNTYKPDNG
jgi:hypothetical protein